MKIIRAVVWSAAWHCSETWTMRENEIDRLQAFECGYGEEWRRTIGNIRWQMTDIWDSEGKKDANRRNVK